MKNTKSALLVGVGGQGAILTAKVLVNGLMKAGYDVKMSEVHGMSQRGGSVSTQVHWSILPSSARARRISSSHSKKWKPCAILTSSSLTASPS